ncbi:MAG: permease-like cell division protein FtsX [Desulfobacterales bacterium]
MRTGLFLFFTKRALQDIKSNRFLHMVTIITIALSILIVSAFGLFFTNVNDIIRSWEKGVRIMAYLNPDTEKIQLPELKNQILVLPGVSSVSFISRDNALKKLKKQMKRQASLFENLKENPLPDVFEIRMSPATQSWEKVEILAAQIEVLPQIEGVEYGQKWLGRMTGIFDLFKFAGTVMCFVFFMASVFIVANTIRLLFYSRHEEFEIMRLVGATDGFIKGPFYIEGMIQGIFGGGIGIAALFVIYVMITSNVEQGVSSGYFTLRFIPLEISAGIIFCSMLAGWLGCYLSLKKFLTY